jgi:phosphohistidine swiveling domain-containing protein
MKKIVWSRDAGAPLQLIGGKAFGLHALKKIGFNVPKWATLTTEFFSQEPDMSLLQEVWDEISEKGTLQVAVRSSAVDEDGSKLSFAGQMDSFLNVATFADFLQAVRGCAASVFSDRAVAYRKQNGIDPWKAKTAVVVQQMVHAEVSGVIFTANPLNHSLDEMLVTSVHGLGEGLVSGKLDSDTYILNRSGKIIQSQTIDDSLTADQIESLHQFSLRAEKAQGVPLDIEFSILKNQIYFLQARPITSLKPKKIWDNSNITESYSGVTTPLTFSFIKEAYFAVYCQFCETIGVSKKTIFKNRHILKNMLGLIQGRVYYNLLNWYELISLMPGFQYNKGFMEQMMGLQVVKEGKPPSSLTDKYLVQLPRLLKVSCKMILAHFRLPKQIKKFHSHFDRIYARYSKLDYTNMPPEEMLAVYRTLEEEVLWKWRSPITNDFEAMIFYGLLKKLTPEGVSANDLLSGEGDITSTALISELMQLAQEVPNEFMNSTPEEAYAFLKNSAKFNHYLEKYGVRCINEMKLESIPIKDDPLFCVSAIQNFLRTGIPEPKENLRQKAEELLTTKKKPLLYNWILNNARKAIRNRENQRFARTQAYSLVRTLVLAIGGQWHKKEILSQPRDIFYLELDEIWSYIEGTSTCVNLKGLIELRKQEFQAYTQENPDDRIETTGEVYFGNPFADPLPNHQEGVIKGLGCCSGIVEGEVKVVLAPDSGLKLNKEIMVAKQTDPGWGVLFPSVSGLIIEKGSMLSHSAIVAREMGIPAVIGVKNATKIFKSGERVRLDGAQGTITKQ